MSARNTSVSYGLVARSLHWLTALLILTAIPLGLYANSLPYDTGAALAAKAQVFSIHKTIGVTAFFVALARILWALTQTRPAPIHPDRQAESWLAELVHWALYLSLVIVPLSGWIHHAATDGFAPILWPFGQDLPFVPTSDSLAAIAGSCHFIFTKVLVVSILLHVLGALKHLVIDRDGTLARMITGRAAGDGTGPHPSTPIFAAVALYAAATLLAVALVPETTAVAATQAPAASPATGAGNWQVAEGTLGFSVRQMGADVAGTFATWTADIAFEEAATEGKYGSVTVTIDTASLALGSVSDQAKSADFFDVAQHPQAVFKADILPAEAGTYIARGTLSLRGKEMPVDLPFTLQITGDTAKMSGETTLDRRDFGMGASYPDESSVGFSVAVKVALTAKRVGG